MAPPSTTDAIKGTGGKTPIEAAKEAALAAGALLVARLHEVKQVSFKGRGNLVTDVDLEAERRIFALLSAEFPSMGLLGEESSGELRSSGYTWIVDPLDGTRNYASGIPFFSVVVALALNGEVVAGVNYDPVREEMFHAERGRGAFLNDRPIRVSEKAALDQCILGMDMSYNNEGARNGLEVVLSLWPGMQTARIMGSSALGLSYAAAGRYDLYFHHHLEPWDVAAGLLLIEEAGGVVTDRAGRRAGLYSDGLVGSSAALHAEFMRRTEGMAWRRTGSEGPVT